MKNNLFEYTEDDRFREWNLFRVKGVWRVLIIWDKALDWGWNLELEGSVQGATLGHLIIGF